jgi:hypothetical protein
LDWLLDWLDLAVASSSSVARRSSSADLASSTPPGSRTSRLSS